MARDNDAPQRTSIKTPQHGNARITVAYRPQPDAPAETVTGDLVTHYSDTRYMIEDDEGTQIIVDRKDGHNARIYTHDTHEQMGRPVYQTVEVPEKGEADHEGEDSTDLGASVTELVEGI